MSLAATVSATFLPQPARTGRTTSGPPLGPAAWDDIATSSTVADVGQTQ